jgi:tryptophan synthase beta subunit
MKKPPKKVFTVRLDTEIVEAVQALGFTLTEAIENALKAWIARQKDKK